MTAPGRGGAQRAQGVERRCLLRPWAGWPSSSAGSHLGASTARVSSGCGARNHRAPISAAEDEQRQRHQAPALHARTERHAVGRELDRDGHDHAGTNRDVRRRNDVEHRATPAPTRARRAAGAAAATCAAAGRARGAAASPPACRPRATTGGAARAAARSTAHAVAATPASRSCAASRSTASGAAAGPGPSSTATGATGRFRASRATRATSAGTTAVVGLVDAARGRQRDETNETNCADTEVT